MEKLRKPVWLLSALALGLLPFAPLALAQPPAGSFAPSGAIPASYNLRPFATVCLFGSVRGVAAPTNEELLLELERLADEGKVPAVRFPCAPQERSLAVTASLNVTDAGRGPQTVLTLGAYLPHASVPGLGEFIGAWLWTRTIYEPASMDKSGALARVGLLFRDFARDWVEGHPARQTAFKTLLVEHEGAGLAGPALPSVDGPPLAGSGVIGRDSGSVIPIVPETPLPEAADTPCTPGPRLRDLERAPRDRSRDEPTERGLGVGGGR